MQGFTAVHLGAIVATLWVLLLNGIVGFQVLDDGTPVSLGLILLSGIAFFVGTGYIVLDTAFSYTHTFVPSLSGPDNRNIALYVLYQLWPLICLAGFFILETILVLRVLGEKKPMRMWFLNSNQRVCCAYIKISISHGGRAVVCYWPNLPVRHQYPHLSRNSWQDRWRPLRNILHASIRYHDMGLLVKYYRRRLAYADIRGEHIHIMALPPKFSFLCDV